MKNETIDELPIHKLRKRAATACEVLHQARRHLAKPGALVILDAALERADRLLPGLLRPTPCAPESVAMVERMRPGDRAALRELLRGGGDVAPGTFVALRDATAAEILEAIERVEICEAAAGELMHVLRVFEDACVRGACVQGAWTT